MSQPVNTISLKPARGTKSLIRGEWLSVRLPSRIVPICVSEPIGLASPRRTASTPAIIVVATAPSPTTMIPSFPVAGSIFAADFVPLCTSFGITFPDLLSHYQRQFSGQFNLFFARTFSVRLPLSVRLSLDSPRPLEVRPDKPHRRGDQGNLHGEVE